MDTELLLAADWIIPADGVNRILEQHCIAIDDGRISAIIPQSEATSVNARTRRSLPRHVLMPGLINAHTHAAMALMRGIADDLPLMDWLKNHIWPAEQASVSEDFVHDGTQLAVAEMIRSGTTCFNDMYFFPDIVANASLNAGIRASVGLIAVEFPSAWAQHADEYVRKGLEVHDRFRNDALIRTAFAPHAPYTVDDGTLSHIRMLSDELNIPVHIHLHETEIEVRESLEKHGLRPIQRLDKLGLLSPSLNAVHMTALSDNDIDSIARNGSHVVHCPESNLKLASGFCPVRKLVAADVNIALGTDGSASNNDLNMLGEMRTAALLAKAVGDDAATLPALEAIKMATINGARALGIDNETGSLEAGKSADLISIDLSELEARPAYDPISQIVYATDRRQVKNVWVAGKPLMEERRLLTLDENEILSSADAWQTRLACYHN